jgi:hypothetical protein
MFSLDSSVSMSYHAFIEEDERKPPTQTSRQAKAATTRAHGVGSDGRHIARATRGPGGRGGRSTRRGIMLRAGGAGGARYLGDPRRAAYSKNEKPTPGFLSKNETPTRGILIEIAKMATRLQDSTAKMMYRPRKCPSKTRDGCIMKTSRAECLVIS